MKQHTKVTDSEVAWSLINLCWECQLNQRERKSGCYQIHRKWFMNLLGLQDSCMQNLCGLTMYMRQSICIPRSSLHQTSAV